MKTICPEERKNNRTELSYRCTSEWVVVNTFFLHQSYFINTRPEYNYHLWCLLLSVLLLFVINSHLLTMLFSVIRGFIIKSAAEKQDACVKAKQLNSRFCEMSFNGRHLFEKFPSKVSFADQIEQMFLLMIFLCFCFQTFICEYARWTTVRVGHHQRRKNALEYTNGTGPIDFLQYTSLGIDKQWTICANDTITEWWHI